MNDIKVSLIKKALENNQKVTFYNSSYQTACLWDENVKRLQKQGICVYTYEISDARENGYYLEVYIPFFKAWIEVIQEDEITLKDYRLSENRFNQRVSNFFKRVKNSKLPEGAELFWEDSPLNQKDILPEDCRIRTGEHSTMTYTGGEWKSDLDRIKNEFSVYQKIDFKW